MAEKGVKVFGMWASPMAIRVEWALRLKGVECEYVDEDLANKSEALLRYNPVTKKIPVLVHDGKPIAESTVIVEYVDEAWKDGYPFMPADPYERAQARFWARFAEEKCNPALYPIFSTTGEAQRKVVHEAQQCLKTLETALKGKKFFGGDSVGYLDIVVGWFAPWLPIIEEASGASVVTDEELPLMKAWFDRRRRDQGGPARQGQAPRAQQGPSRAVALRVEDGQFQLRFMNTGQLNKCCTCTFCSCGLEHLCLE